MLDYNDDEIYPSKFSDYNIEIFIYFLSIIFPQQNILKPILRIINTIESIFKHNNLIGYDNIALSKCIPQQNDTVVRDFR